MELTEEDLKEIFSLFTSPSKYEKAQIYDEKDAHYYKEQNLDDSYDLSQEKREYAYDAWRAVVYFMHIHGYRLQKGNKVVELDFIEDEFA
jgi:hypothetical protein